MPLTPKQLIRATLTNAVATYYTATDPIKTRIDNLSVCNYSAGAVTFSLYLVPSGGTAGDSNILVKNRSVAAGASGRVLEAFGQWLEAGGTIQMVASANSAVTVSASGIEQTAI